MLPFGSRMNPKIVTFDVQSSFARHLTNQQECSYWLLRTRPLEEALTLLQSIGQAVHS